MTIRFEDKDPGDIIVVEFDFTADTTAVDAPTIAVTVATGTDPDPAMILVGGPTVEGARVLQRIRDGIDGVDYALKCAASSGADRFTVEAILPVRLRPITVDAAPRYCTEAQFEQRFGQREASDLLADGNSYARAENDAASLVDGFLSARYTLPLASVPAIVVGWTADITRFRLWDDHAPEEVRKRYEDALSQLRDLARGVIALPPDASGAKPAGGGFDWDGYGNERVFTADTLGCF